MCKRLMCWLIGPPDMQASQGYRDAVDWSTSWRTEENDQGDLVLEFAYRYWAELLRRHESIDARLAGILKLSGTIGVLLFASVKALEIEAGPAIVTAFCFLVAAMLLVLHTRWAFKTPAPASIREVVEGCGKVGSPKTWLAITIHLLIVGMAPRLQWMAQRLATSTILLGCAVLLLGAGLFSSHAF